MRSTHSGAATPEAESVYSQATDPPMIGALVGANSLQLYQLKALIEGMLADPRRGIEARANCILDSVCSSSTSAMVRCAAARSLP